MPLYAFKCACGHEWDESRLVADRNRPTPCPMCRAEGVRILVPPTIHGFTEYADENLSAEGDAKPYVVKSRADRERRRKELGLCDPGPSLRSREVQRDIRRQAKSVTINRG